MNKLFLILLIGFTPLLKAQNQNDKKVIQLTGVIVEADSLKPMPFVHLTVKNMRIGTISDYYGFFSLVAHEGDTIEFSSVGYHRNQFILPDSMNGNSSSIIHLMIQDTILLKEFTVFPWPTREQFKYAFMHEDIPDNGLARAKKNLSKEALMAAAGGVPMQGSTTYKYELQNRYTQLYIGDGFPQYKILDPIAWSKFIKAWKNGDFKKKKNNNIYYLPND
jgi:CarboxypepD_reg-like domain